MKDSFVEPVEYLEEIGKAAKAAETGLALLSSVRKNEVLCAVADALVSRSEFILEENRTDADDWVRKGKDEGMLDRLLLSEDRIEGMATGLRQVASLEDPIGEVLYMKERPNGLMIGEKRVPLGVIGIIYESRPNVTADAFGLCFKTGNVVILKGGSDAINSNKAIIKVIRDVLESMDIDPNVVSLIESTDREVTKHFMQMNDYIDVLIPRGGAGLIRTAPVKTSFSKRRFSTKST